MSKQITIPQLYRIPMLQANHQGTKCTVCVRTARGQTDRLLSRSKSDENALLFSLYTDVKTDTRTMNHETIDDHSPVFYTHTKRKKHKNKNNRRKETNKQKPYFQPNLFCENYDLKVNIKTISRVSDQNDVSRDIVEIYRSMG